MPFSGKVGALTALTLTPQSRLPGSPILATTTIAHLPADLPGSRALDYRAMSAIRGAGLTGEWCLCH